MAYHVPVMLKECLEGLNIKPDGVYVDITFGGGGHSRAILEKLSGGKLFAFDQDDDAENNARAITHPGFQFIKANFRDMKRYLKMYGAKEVDGILADLGVSSHQFDIPDRGFSIRFDAELDMRMDQNASLTAKQVINEWSESDLHKLLGMYGEVTNARTVAATLKSARARKPINTVFELKEVLAKLAPRGRENKYFAQIFQAFRIVVNDEMKVLEEMLPQTAEVIKPYGRLVIMAYHSLEDRLVKNYVNNGKLFGDVEKDFYGNLIRPFKPINKKPMEPSEAELEINNRSRSAKLRIAERT